MVAELGQRIGFFDGKKPTVIFSDNKAALDWAQTQAYKPRTKHIDVDCKFIREHIGSRILKSSSSEPKR